MTERKRKPKEERKKRILELSKGVFAKYGFRKTTMEDIAREIGFTSAAIYYYFESKEELFKECISEEFNKVIVKIEEEVSQVEKADEKLKRFIEAKVSGMRELIKIFNMTDEVVGEIRAEIERLGIKDIAVKELKILDNIIKEGIEKKVFREVDTKKTALVIQAVVKELISAGITRKKDIEEVADIVLKGIMS